jgi:Tol biopolymer transport system component
MKAKKPSDKFTVAFLVLWLMMLACSSLLPAAATDIPDPTGSIVYSSDESGNFEIYHMNIRSLETVRLTDNSSFDTFPFYLPPARFGFAADRSGKYQVYTMDMDGANQKAWKKGDRRILFTPSVSPDGKKMAYVVQNNDENSNLYLADLDGNKEEQLTDIRGMEWDPSWSPDGTRIVFSSDVGGDFEINVIDLESSQITKLTDNAFYDGRPHWSPDGDQILFESDQDGDWEIYTMDIDGGNVRAITENATGDWLANWSPDGHWIVYVSNHDGDDEIYIIGVDGKDQWKLTNNTAQDQYPAWVP